MQKKGEEEEDKKKCPREDGLIKFWLTKQVLIPWSLPTQKKGEDEEDKKKDVMTREAVFNQVSPQWRERVQERHEYFQGTCSS
jgi:hypothetical protein